jgi:glycosyltransferase involved in cell wall biosynthesis
MRALERIAASQRPDILHLQWLALPLIDRHFLGGIGRRAGLVLTVHDSQTFHGSSNASWLQLWGDRGARSIFDHYVVHTEQTRAALRGIGIDDGRISVLPHPPLHLILAPGTDTKPNTHPTRILFFGSIKRYKGVDILVDAGLTLAAAGVDFVIDIAGRPFEPVEELEARIAAAGAERHFRFDCRYIPDEDLSRYLHAADLVVFPYRQIDASGALALAVEAEKPIVASGIGVFAEPPARDCLHLVAPGDATRLAEGLRELIGNASALDGLRRRTRQLKSAVPSWDDFARQCLAVYHCLCVTGAH